MNPHAWLNHALRHIHDLRKRGHTLRAEPVEDGGGAAAAGVCASRAADDAGDLNPACFQVLMRVPVIGHGPYNGSAWWVRFTITPKFPFASPSVAVLGDIQHPNIHSPSGAVCVDALNSSWSPATRLSAIVEIVLPALLTHPNTESPLNDDNAALLVRDARAWEAHVRAHTQKHSVSIHEQHAETRTDASVSIDVSTDVSADAILPSPLPPTTLRVATLPPPFTRRTMSAARRRASLEFVGAGAPSPSTEASSSDSDSGGPRRPHPSPPSPPAAPAAAAAAAADHDTSPLPTASSPPPRQRRRIHE